MEVKECVLFGSVPRADEHLLRERLAGLCEPVVTHFKEEEYAMQLCLENRQPLRVRLRRDVSGANKQQRSPYQLRYIGTPEADPSCPCTLRKTLDTMVQCQDIMLFVGALGLRNVLDTHEFTFKAEGAMFTQSHMKIIIMQIQRAPSQGDKPLTESLLVEINMAVGAADDYRQVARSVRLFADQLRPLLNMQKMD